MEDVMANLLILISGLLCLCILLVFIQYVRKLWWIPIRVNDFMQKQGVKGPDYRFIHGNNREIFQMRKESMSKPMELSHHMFLRIQPDIYSWIRVYGENYLQCFGARPQLVVTDSEMIREILNNKYGAYGKRKPENFTKKLLGYGLVTSEGAKWAKMRKVANHAFHIESLKGMIPAMIASTEMMLERWKDYEGKEIDVYKEFRLLTSEVISRTAFGSSYMEGENIFNMLMRMSALTQTNTFNIRIPVISKFLNSDEAEADRLQKGIRDSLITIISSREEKLMNKEEKSDGDDFLGRLLKAHHDVDQTKRISLDDVIDECKTFYFAGQETTSSLLDWSTLLLAIHRDWQEEARKEVLQIFGQSVPNAEGISKLKTMHMIIYETLRLYPPVVGILRGVMKEVKLGNKLILPTHLNLFISTLAAHHDPKVWGEDVHLFKPERFAEGIAKATNNNITAFIPFGMGPRNCVGFNFATIEAKIALSMVLQRYSFTLSPAYVHSPYQLLTLQPKHGVQVILGAVH